MDSGVPQMDDPRPTRRSTRQSSNKVLNVEPTPRGPLKRTKRKPDNQNPVTAVNGSKNNVNASGDEESPNKKGRQETEVVNDSGDTEEMDDLTAEETQEMKEDQEMIQEDSPHSVHQPKKFLESLGKHPIGDRNLAPCVVLKRCQFFPTEDLDMDRLMSKSGPAASTKSPSPLRDQHHGPQTPVTKKTSMKEYKEKMEAKVRTTGIPRPINYSTFPAPEGSYTIRQRKNNTSVPTLTVQRKKHGVNKAVNKGNTGSSRGFLWYLWRMALMLLLICAGLLVYKYIPAIPQSKPDDRGHPPRSVDRGVFTTQLSALESHFPGQHPELWKRSRIHLEKHLQTAHPTEPVSLMLTAGHKAEKTLFCLAKGLASAFSSALNASVLHIDGATKANQDSDQVKLDIDRQLDGAFKGDKPVAVIHRFEELPPGSTLIFYRYCDHENAAYKRVFLAFTVLLPQEEVDGQQSLIGVEEMVQNYIEERFVLSSSWAAFNKMDTDKFSGLWSRISHLILPVAAEKDIEEKGC